MLALLLAATLTIEDYAVMPAPSSPRWSPDGKRIAYVLTKADLERSTYDSDVWVIDADGRNDRQLTRARGADFRPRWSPDGTRLAFLSDREGRNAIYVIDLGGGESRKLFDAPTAVREFEWSPDGTRIAFTRVDEPPAEEEKRIKERDDARVVGEGRRQLHLYVADMAGGKPRRVTSGDFTVVSFSWSPDGGTIVLDRAPGTGLDDLYRTDIYSVSVESGELRPLVVQPGLDRNAAFSPDGKWIAYTSTGGVHDWLREHDVYVMPAGGGASRKLTATYDRTPESIAWSDDSKAVFIEGPRNSTTQLYRVNVDGSNWTDTTRFEGTIDDADVSGERAAYIRQSLTEPPELYAGGTRLTNHNAAYRDRTLGETRVIRWKNPKDGLEIEGLLTLPVHYKGGRVPLLTFVHGGPASRFFQGYIGYLGFYYAPQVLAAEGYAVLRPNPRGTGGYGSAFHVANRNDWAGMDWLDVNAGIDRVIADGIADPKRLGMMGWSYGGYLAAWAIGHSDRFRAFSIGAPPVDLASFHGTTDIRDFIPHYFGARCTLGSGLQSAVGSDPTGGRGMGSDPTAHCRPDPKVPLELLRARSPLWHLKKTSAKVLIQHGDADDRVPLSQGTMLYRFLDELGVDVTMVVYPRAGHYVREPKLRMDVMRRNVEHFRKTIPTDRP